MSEELLIEPQLVIELVFKPQEPGRILREAESDLFAAAIGEILQEIEAEERLIIEEEKAKNG